LTLIYHSPQEAEGVPRPLRVAGWRVTVYCFQFTG